MPTRILVVSAKGGIGRSTTACLMSTALAEVGHDVGVLDLDPQGNVSTSFGIPKSALERTVYDLIMNDLGEDLPLVSDYLIGPEIITDFMHEAWRQTNPDKKPPRTMGVKNLWLLPSNVQLAAAEITNVDIQIPALQIVETACTPPQ